MSREAAEENTDNDVVCANCGIAEVDEIKLVDCDGCDLVKYCSDKCREEHREQHHEECKRRAGELHDKRLFTQPDRNHIGECPICFLPCQLSCCSNILYSNTCFHLIIFIVGNRYLLTPCLICIYHFINIISLSLLFHYDLFRT